MTALKVLILALIGAIIGWVTNIIAIKLMFRPLEPINIPVLNIKIQGLIPKRKSEFAKSIGEVIAEELLSMDDIMDKVIEEENLSEILNTIKSKINKIVEEKMPALIPSTFRRMIYGYIDDIIENDGERIFKELIEKMMHKVNDKVNIAEIVEEKINSFEMEKIEKIIIAIVKKELKHIEILGGILGFLIGIMQGIFVILL